MISLVHKWQNAYQGDQFKERKNIWVFSPGNYLFFF